MFRLLGNTLNNSELLGTIKLIPCYTPPMYCTVYFCLQGLSSNVDADEIRTIKDKISVSLLCNVYFALLSLYTLQYIILMYHVRLVKVLGVLLVKEVRRYQHEALTNKGWRQCVDIAASRKSWQPTG
jgi:hypothetical protein